MAEEAEPCNQFAYSTSSSLFWLSTLDSSRIQQPFVPTTFLLFVHHTLVQSSWLPQPKFDLIGHHSITGPEIGARHVLASELPFISLDLFLERLTRVEDRGLSRGPGTDLAVSRPSRLVLVRLIVRHQFDVTDNSDLLPQLVPMEAKCGLRIPGQLRRFGAARVGIENGSTLVQLAQQDDTGGRHALSIYRGQSKGHRLLECRLLGPLQDGTKPSHCFKKQFV